MRLSLVFVGVPLLVGYAIAQDVRSDDRADRNDRFYRLETRPGLSVAGGPIGLPTRYYSITPTYTWTDGLSLYNVALRYGYAPYGREEGGNSDNIGAFTITAKYTRFSPDEEEDFDKYSINGEYQLNSDREPLQFLAGLMYARKQDRSTSWTPYLTAIDAKTFEERFKLPIELAATAAYDITNEDGGDAEKGLTVDVDAAYIWKLYKSGEEEPYRKIWFEVDYAFPNWGTEFDYYAQVGFTIDRSMNQRFFFQLSRDSAWTIGYSRKF